MKLYVFIALISFFSMLCLGIFVLTRNPRNTLYRIFFLFNVSAAAWIFNSFLLWSSRDAGSALVWKGANFLLSSFIPALFMHLGLIVIGEVEKFKKLLYANYAICACFALVSQTPLLISGVTSFAPYFNYIPTRGVLFVPFVVFFYSSAAFVYIRLIRAIGRTAGNLKLQIQYMAFATVLGFISTLIYFLLLYKVNVEKFIPHDLLTLAYSFIIAYAIVRHKLMDIDVIVKKTLVFAGLLAAVFAILVLPTLIIQEYLVRETGRGGRMIGLVISGIIIIATMRKIEDFLINITDRFLFQKKYDYKELLKTFTAEVLTVLNLDKLMNLTVDKLIDTIKLDSSAVLLFDDADQKFNVMASRNLMDPSVNLGRSDELATFLERVHGYFMRKELSEKKVYIPPHVQEVIDKMNAELMIPMILQEKVIGILVLGKKKSDEDYTQHDLDILLPLARTLAIAISNAQLFNELSKTQAEAAQREKMAVIGTLSAGINHEICNPLGIARGQCEAFLLNVKDGLYDDKSPDELLAKAKHIMEMVMKEVDRATVITKKLSTFAKPAKGAAEMVGIDKEIDYVMSLVNHDLKLEKIEVVKDIPPDLPGIFVDRKQFQEVLFNLIRNSAQAIGEKGKIAITAREARNKIVVDIADSGSGIPEDKIRELFNPFFTTKDPDKGTGLGLFIVRQVVEKNHGRIYLKDTKVGGGTTFALEFPVMVRDEVKV